jgi:uncharacterized protein YndB with AHSA1/START domain
MWWLWVIGGIIAAIVLFFVIMTILGKKLPEEHVASLSVDIHQPQETAWEAVSNLAEYRHWSPGVTKAERLPDHENHERWRLHMGRNAAVLQVTQAQRPVHLTFTIADEHGPFSGSWEYTIAPSNDGSRVTLTERGRIANAAARAMMRYVFGEAVYIRKHLRGLAKKFNEEPRIT